MNGLDFFHAVAAAAKRLADDPAYKAFARAVREPMPPPCEPAEKRRERMRRERLYDARLTSGGAP